MGRGVVLASQRFNGENAWMLKRKWVECWDISREFWVHYRNFNGAGAGRGCEFWGNRSGIVCCFQQKLNEHEFGRIVQLMIFKA